MRAELKRMGLSLDWERELATCHPGYYQHQQKLFLDFLKAGLAYRKEAFVNWDPVDHTVLANEQVIDGRGWRSGAPVEKRKLSQWFLKITDYADELLTALKRLDRWPEKVRLMQENWIGTSTGAYVHFQHRRAASDRASTIFTTRPDTLFGASFWRCRPIIRWPTTLAKTDPEARRLHRRMPRAPARPRRRSRRRRRAAIDTGLEGAASRSSPARSCRSTSPISC